MASHADVDALSVGNEEVVLGEEAIEFAQTPTHAGVHEALAICARQDLEVGFGISEGGFQVQLSNGFRLVCGNV